MATGFYLGTEFEKKYIQTLISLNDEWHPVEPEGIIYKKINSHNTHGAFFIPGEALVNIHSLAGAL